MTNPRRLAVEWITDAVEGAANNSPVYGVTICDSVYAPLTPRVANQREYIRPFYLTETDLAPGVGGVMTYRNIALAFGVYVAVAGPDKRRVVDEQDRATAIMQEIWRLVNESNLSGTQPTGICRWHVVGCAEVTHRLDGVEYAVMSFAVVLNPTVEGINWRGALKAAGTAP